VRTVGATAQPQQFRRRGREGGRRESERRGWEREKERKGGRERLT